MSTASKLLPQINRFFFFLMLVLKYNEGHSFSHLVQTAQVNSRPETYGPHGKFPPHVHSTKYIKAPFVFAWVPGMNSGSLSTQMNSFWFCGCSEKSSDTHDTPRSIQMDSHSERASSALSHVTRHSRRHKAHFGLVDFCQKG